MNKDNNSTKTHDFILHIGNFKTGTTSIQRDLFLNEKLLEADGFFFPQAFYGNGEYKYHGRIARNLLSWLFNKDFFDTNFLDDMSLVDNLSSNFKNELKDQESKKIIISHEALFNLENHRIDKLLDLILPFAKSLKIEVYLRNQSKYHSSWVSQDLRHLSLSALKDTDLEIQQGLGRYLYDKILKKWESKVGRENINVHLYDEIIEKDENISKHFFYNLGISFSPIFENSKKLESLSLKEKQIIYVCLRYKEGLPQFEALQLLSSIFEEEFPVSFDLDDEVLQAIKKDNDSWSERYFNKKEIFKLNQ